MAIGFKEVFTLVKESFKDFGEDECPRLAAALSYYTVFAIPPMLILIMLLVSVVMDPEDVSRIIEGQAGSMMGDAGAIHDIVTRAEQDRPRGAGLSTALGIAAVIFGATGAFLQLQGALNRVWEVKPDPKAGGIKNFVFKRLLSLGMILSVAFLLLVSLAISAMMSAVGDALGRMLGMSGVIGEVLNNVVSFGVIFLLFAAIFKVLPDARVAWRDVWVGAAVTALLFTIGKFALGLYLGRSNPGEAYGAAGSLALMLVWIYYSAMIVLFGAEFTQKWAEAKGSGIVPEEGAVRVVEETHIIKDGRRQTG